MYASINEKGQGMLAMNWKGKRRRRLRRGMSKQTPGNDNQFPTV